MTDSHMDKAPSKNNVPWVMDGPEMGYVLSGRKMLTVILILFAVAIVIFLVILYYYARWYILRLRRRHLNHRPSRPQRASRLVFYVDPNSAITTGGLDASVLNSLPVFVYSSKTHPDQQECAVCLSEFEQNEKGRILPKCNHSFHTDCIDMWFQSNSTCPLCRSQVEPPPVQVSQNSQPDIVTSVGAFCDSEPGSSSGLRSTCQHEEGKSGTTSLAGRRSGLDTVGVTIEVPRRNELENDLRLTSPLSQGFRSPGTRLMSLKRILSMNKKAMAVSPSFGVGTSCGQLGTESDVESARRDPTEGKNGDPAVTAVTQRLPL